MEMHIYRDLKKKKETQNEQISISLNWNFVEEPFDLIKGLFLVADHYYPEGKFRVPQGFIGGKKQLLFLLVSF